MKRLQAIDILRGLACLAVLLLHIPHDLAESGMIRVIFLPFDFGYLGVPMFLLISGFCIHSGASRQESVDWTSFWKRRVWRLYPPYLVMVALSVVALFIAPTATYDRTNLHWDIVVHLLMIHNLFAEYAGSLGNFPFWSLGLEEQLYALYALYLLLRKRLSPMGVLLIASVVLVVWRLLFPWTIGVRIGPIGAFRLWPFGYWAFWVLGALAAEAHAGRLSLPRWCYSRILMATLFTMGVLTGSMTLRRVLASNWALQNLEPAVVTILNHAIWLSDPAFFTAAFFILMNRWISQEDGAGLSFTGAGLLAKIGLISYSLYLTHVPVLRVLELSLPIPHSIGGTFIRYTIYIPICLTVANGFFWLVERHFLKSPGKRWRQSEIRRSVDLGPPPLL